MAEINNENKNNNFTKIMFLTDILAQPCNVLC